MNQAHTHVNGILLLYAHRYSANAPTIIEHVNSFKKYSCFDIINVNTELGFPAILNRHSFPVIVLHYSLFGSFPFRLSARFIEFLQGQQESLKVSFFQDEYQYVAQRFNLINSLGIDVIFTLLEPQHFEEVYYKHTCVKKVYHTLTGYVDQSLVDKANKLYKPFTQRKIDVGYRARPLSFHMGKGAQEKTQIAEKFISSSQGLNLTLNIKTAEADRIYGDAWHQFIANCKAMLGVEAGVSIFDIQDKVRPAVQELLNQNPNITFEEVHQRVVSPWEENIYYRTISPRIFEMAAVRVAMILFEGKYQNILKPLVHYIPLRKDFSNFNEVIQQLKNDELIQRLTDNAYNDLIKSGAYSYSKFIAQFDSEIKPFVPLCSANSGDIRSLKSAIDRYSRCRLFLFAIKEPLHKQWPGKAFVKKALLFTGLLRRS